MHKSCWQIGPITPRWFLKMLVVPGLVTYLAVALGCHLVYLHSCAEARAMTARINARADILRRDPRWAWKLIGPQDLVRAGVISETDLHRVIPGQLHFSRYLSPTGGPFAVWTCDDSAGHQQYPDVSRLKASDPFSHD